MSRPEPGTGNGKDTITILDRVAVVWRHRWLIAGLWLLCLVAAILFSILTPKIFEAKTTLMSQREGRSDGLLGNLAIASGVLQYAPGLSIPSFTPNRDMVVSILRSRTVAQAVAERFRLQERYRARYFEDALRELASATTISVSKEGVITVKVEDTDPRVAADMANFYAQVLDRLVARYGTSEAGRQRVFLAEQVARAKADLELAEEALRRFQELNRAIALQDQTRGAIEAAARVKGEVIAAEVQLQVLQNFATDANPEVIALRRRITEMRRQLAQLQYGDTVSDARRDFTVPFPKVPEVGLELIRLTRDLKVQETLVTLLTQQLEQAKIAEARDMPLVQVLDPAVPAERHSRPRLALNLVLATAASLLFGALTAFLRETIRTERGGIRRVHTN